MCSTYNEKKPVVPQRLIRALKENYICINSISRSCIHRLVDIANEYNRAYHSTVKMKTVNLTWSTYIDFRVKNNEKDLKFEICDNVKISKYKNIFTKGCIQMGPKRFW